MGCMRKLPIGLLLLCVATTALAITPPWYRVSWGNALGEFLPGDSLTTTPIDVSRCGAIALNITGYGSDSVSYAIESSFDGVNWVEETSDYPADWSSTPTAPSTTVARIYYEISGTGARNRSVTHYVRYRLENESAVDTLQGFGASICAHCR